jgi:hypothetical protein
MQLLEAGLKVKVRVLVLGGGVVGCLLSALGRVAVGF